MFNRRSLPSRRPPEQRGILLIDLLSKSVTHTRSCRLNCRFPRRNTAVTATADRSSISTRLRNQRFVSVVYGYRVCRSIDIAAGELSFAQQRSRDPSEHLLSDVPLADRKSTRLNSSHVSES